MREQFKRDTGVTSRFASVLFLKARTHRPSIFTYKKRWNVIDTSTGTYLASESTRALSLERESQLRQALCEIGDWTGSQRMAIGSNRRPPFIVVASTSTVVVLATSTTVVCV